MSVGGRLANLERQTGGPEPLHVVVDWRTAEEHMAAADAEGDAVRVVEWQEVDGDQEEDHERRE